MRVIILFLLLHALSVSSQNIILDSTFAINGQATTDIDNADNRAYCLAIQSDNKIVVAGFMHNGHDYDFATIRYNYDGSIDSTFGINGKVITDFEGNNDRIYSVAITDEQKILAAGYSVDSFGISDFCLIRYDSNGGLDTSFGISGKVITRINNNNSKGYGLTIQNDGKIIVVGQCYAGPNGDFAIVRYNPNGSLDSLFYSSGTSIIDFGSWNDKAMSALQRSDGKIIVSGISSNQIAVLRLDLNGTIDSTFATNGKIIINNCLASPKSSMILQNDGKILIAGNYYSDIALIRLYENGFLDTTFNSTGITFIDFGNNCLDNGSSLDIQTDGKIIVTGQTYVNGSYSDVALLRFNNDGSLDSTANLPNGKITTDFYGYNDWGYSTVIQNDGKILVAGESYNGNNYDFALVRYMNSEDANTVQLTPTSNIKVNIFPNPFSNQLTFSIADQEYSIISIYNLFGQQILQQGFTNSATINTSQFAKGVYYYVLSNLYSMLKNGKIVKQ